MTPPVLVGPGRNERCTPTDHGTMMARRHLRGGVTGKGKRTMGWWNAIVDRTIFYSFDRSGFLRHQRSFDPADLQRSMTGKVCLVTGANSGLGLSLATKLAAREATVHLLCRNAERAVVAQRSIVEQTGNAAVHANEVDLSSPGSIRQLVDRLAPSRVDVLVHNAGLLPVERQLTAEGLELTVATHLVGPHLLTRLLRPKLRGARVIFVTSGGMYAKRLDVDGMLANEGPYDGVGAYAMTKRGQVVLSELWAAELADSGTLVNAMHPGWAATAGVERSLPRFWRFMGDRLRTAEQGADTAVWLAVAEKAAGHSGKLWFDRRSVSSHLAWWTREGAAERQRLWDFCEAQTGVMPSHGKDGGTE